MNTSHRWILLLSLTLSLPLAAALPGAAQEPEPATHGQAISANPFGLLLEFFNAEYERVIGETSTVGVGGSLFTNDDIDYINADAFYRYYPSARPLEGFAFGGKMGVTRVPDEGTYFGLGFDLNYSWLLGRSENFYVGIGIGLKRLFGSGGEVVDVDFIPTLRIVNIGFAF